MDFDASLTPCPTLQHFETYSMSSTKKPNCCRLKIITSCFQNNISSESTAKIINWPSIDQPEGIRALLKSSGPHHSLSSSEDFLCRQTWTQAVIQRNISPYTDIQREYRPSRPTKRISKRILNCQENSTNSIYQNLWNEPCETDEFFHLNSSMF